MQFGLPFKHDPTHIDQIFKEFASGEMILSILDCCLQKDDFKKIATFLLGDVSREVFIYKTRCMLYDILNL